LTFFGRERERERERVEGKHTVIVRLSDFFKVSVKNDSNPGFEKNPGIVGDYNKRTEMKTHKMKRPISRTKVNLLLLPDDNSEGGNDELI
jgi:hypothetical protein